MAVLRDLNSDLIAQIAQLKAENARLQATKLAAQRVTLKVTEKGGVSMYGLGRFPVTLYKSQWLKLLAEVDTIAAFIEANASRLSNGKE